MKINVDIDEKYQEVKVEVQSPDMNNEVTDIMNRLNGSGQKKDETVIGYKEESMVILKANKIVSFATSGNYVMANTDKDSFRVKEKLYYLEEKFEIHDFIRISKSALVSLHHIKSIDLHFSGSLIAKLDNGTDEIISRRFVPKVKEAIGIGGNKG
jgi:DNA-binding LytR/AlgR family response regulator